MVFDIFYFLFIVIFLVVVVAVMVFDIFYLVFVVASHSWSWPWLSSTLTLTSYSWSSPPVVGPRCDCLWLQPTIRGRCLPLFVMVVIVCDFDILLVVVASNYSSLWWSCVCGCCLLLFVLIVIVFYFFHLLFVIASHYEPWPWLSSTSTLTFCLMWPPIVRPHRYHVCSLVFVVIMFILSFLLFVVDVSKV